MPPQRKAAQQQQQQQQKTEQTSSEYDTLYYRKHTLILPLRSEKLDIPRNETEEPEKTDVPKPEHHDERSEEEEINDEEGEEEEDEDGDNDIVLIMQVEISPGVSKSLQVKRVQFYIIVYYHSNLLSVILQRDEPREVAERFCIDHSMNSKYIQILTDNIQRHIQAQEEAEDEDDEEMDT